MKAFRREEERQRTKDSYLLKTSCLKRRALMQFAEWTYPLRKFDDIYYTIERIVYTKGELKGFTTEDIYNNLRDKRFFRDVQDLNNFLLENGKKYKIRKIDQVWERYW
jgi:hypothetical protein